MDNEEVFTQVESGTVISEAENVENYVHCSNICKADSQCQVFEFDTFTSTCKTFSSIDGQTFDAGEQYRSGTKLCYTRKLIFNLLLFQQFSRFHRKLRKIMLLQTHGFHICRHSNFVLNFLSRVKLFCNAQG